MNITTNNEFNNRIIGLIEKIKKAIVQVINSQMVMTYWNIGKEIFLEEQKGQDRAEYGKEILEGLSKLLTLISKHCGAFLFLKNHLPNR